MGHLWQGLLWSVLLGMEISLALLIAWALNMVGSIGQVGDVLDLTWYGAGRNLLQAYGFFAMVLFGAIYHIVPQLLDIDIGEGVIAGSVAKLARANAWLAALGVLLVVGPFAVGGIVQGVQLNDSSVPFANIITTSKMTERVATIGELLILAANFVFMVSLGRLVAQYYKARAKAVIAEATAIIPSEGQTTAGLKA